MEFKKKIAHNEAFPNHYSTNFLYICAMVDGKMKFKPLFDWSTWCIIALIVTVCGWPVFIDASLPMIAILACCAAFCIMPFFGTWYEIDGDTLIVYMFWRPSRFPISKIKDISHTKSLLSAPATSLTNRIAITFTDKKVLKSTMPLIISPANQTIFFEILLSINPNITLK